MAGVSGEVKLPSNDLICKTVKIRSLLGKDERALSELATNNAERKIATLLGTLVEGVRVMDLTERDEMALLIWVAINTYSDVYPVKCTCPFCWANIKIDADLSKFEVDYLPDGFKDPVPVKLSDGSVWPVRISRVKDAVAVEDYQKASKSPDTWLFSHAVTVENGKSVVENMKTLGDMPAKDLALIRAVQESHKHGVRMVTAFTCPKCGGAGEMPVPFRLDMVFPTGAELSRLS